MGVGPRFSDPETQAAIAAQAASVTPKADEPAAEPAAVEPEPKPEHKEVVEEPAVKADKPDNAPATEPTNEDAKPVKSDDDLNMDEYTPPSQEEVDKALEAAGFSNEELGKELYENDGKLTKETVEALKKAFPDHAVDNAVADMERQYSEVAAKHAEDVAAKTDAVDKMNDFIYGSLAGGDVDKGKQNLAKLSEWATNNLESDVLEAINAKLRSGNKTVVTEGLQQAVTLWKKGQEKPMMTGDALAATPAEKAPEFTPISKDEFIEIMQTKKYNEDPEYAAKIDERRAKTIAKGEYVTPEYNRKYRPARR
jgi:ribosome-binding protein aMBF1 (putative translation factor)